MESDAVREMRLECDLICTGTWGPEWLCDCRAGARGAALHLVRRRGSCEAPLGSAQGP